MSFLILIDGQKGSGKSTLSELLKQKLSNTEFFSLDVERKQLTRTDSIDNDNKRAFKLITEKLKDMFEQDRNAVLDMGISEVRLKVLETISSQHLVQLYKFSLTAPYDILHSRVKDRDKSRGKDFNKNRFDYTINVQQSKSFTGFTILDSDKLSPEEICERVVMTVDPSASNRILEK